MRLDPWSLPLTLDQWSTWGWIPDPCPYHWINDPHKVGSLISALTTGSMIHMRLDPWSLPLPLDQWSTWGWIPDPCSYHWINDPHKVGSLIPALTTGSYNPITGSECLINRFTVPECTLECNIILIFPHMYKILYVVYYYLLLCNYMYLVYENKIHSFI